VQREKVVLLEMVALANLLYSVGNLSEYVLMQFISMGAGLRRTLQQEKCHGDQEDDSL
jgi:hypothetical protein